MEVALARLWRTGLKTGAIHFYMIESIKQFITENDLLTSSDKIIVGVSGGSDSTSLLLALHELKYSLVIAHINYNTREADSESDEKFVRNLAHKLSLECEVFVGSDPCVRPKSTDLDQGRHTGRPLQSNFEAWARDIRYKFFEEVRGKYQADKIAVAHNSNDLVETMLLNLFRGAGPRGLAGMSAKRGLIVRPLLNIWRKDVLDFLQTRKQDYREDKTNLDTKYKRNWIRHKLLPSLRENIDGQIDEQLKNQSKLFAMTAQMIEQEAQDKLKELEIGENKFDLDGFFDLPSLLQGEIVRSILGKRDIGQVHVNEVLDLLKNSEPEKHKIFAGIKITKKRGTFLVTQNS